MNEKSSSSSQEKGSSDKSEFNETNKNLIEINKQLLETNEQLKIQNKKLQDFIDIAAHELRTPIMPIMGYAEVLREDIGERKEIKGIIYNARKLEQLAENILDSTKIENQTLKLNKEKFISTASSGTGLGLFVSRNIIRAHGGEIWAENNPDGEGAIFSFRIPKIQGS